MTLCGCSKSSLRAECHPVCLDIRAEWNCGHVNHVRCKLIKVGFMCTERSCRHDVLNGNDIVEEGFAYTERSSRQNVLDGNNLVEEGFVCTKGAADRTISTTTTS